LAEGPHYERNRHFVVDADEQRARQLRPHDAVYDARGGFARFLGCLNCRPSPDAELERLIFSQVPATHACNAYAKRF
jgi:hypothetical protein